jgi:hypothetical protein
MPAATNWAALGYKSGQGQAERDGAYYDPQWGYVVNGLEGEDEDGVQDGVEARGAEIAPQIILALQPDRPHDAQFQADCQRFAQGFAQGYMLALI